MSLRFAIVCTISLIALAWVWFALGRLLGVGTPVLTVAIPAAVAAYDGGRQLQKSLGRPLGRNEGWFASGLFLAVAAVLYSAAYFGISWVQARDPLGSGESALLVAGLTLALLFVTIRFLFGLGARSRV